jgi:hypothetical protein
MYKSLCNDEILAELIQAGHEILLSVIHKLINPIWNKGQFPHQWKESIIVLIHKKGYKTVIIIMGYYSYQFHKIFNDYPTLNVKSINRCNYCGSSAWVSL